MTKGSKMTDEQKERLSKSHLGQISWNRGTKGLMKSNKTSFVLEDKRIVGNKINLGKTPWNKGTKGICKSNSGSFKKGNIPPLKGKHHTEESKEKDRLAHLGKPSKSKTKFVKGVPSWNKGIHIDAIRGDKCWNWKGGITPENRKIRTSLEMKLWRKSCFERDNFTCKKCGQIGGELRVHHINNFADFPELRLSIDNGITLCKHCHTEFHHKYGYKNNTHEQLNEFLNI